MRTLIVMMVATAALAGCTVKETVVKPAETPPTVVYQQPPTVVYQQPPVTSGAPRIAYTVIGESQLNQATVQAASWCNTNRYGSGARLIDRQRSTGGDIVTFECSTP
jgi:hypothetical protein